MTTIPARTPTVRRTIDVVVAVVLALVAAPICLLVAVMILVTSGRPVLFRQRRSGLGGREFDIVKFRTMRPARDPGEPDADRQDVLGRVLRWSSLDEIPQLWNILVGEMTFIGPRPTLPEQVARYSSHERGRLAVLPGITGWAQVNGRNSLSWPERIELDLWYIEHRSLTLDLRILVRTAARLVRPAGVVGAGGVNPGFPGPRMPVEDSGMPLPPPPVPTDQAQRKTA